MSADLYFTGILSFFLLFSSATRGARWKERNQNRPHARKWVRFENACPKSGVSPLFTNRVPKTTLFRRLHNLMSTLTAYIFGMKRDVDNWSSALTTTRGLLQRVKTTWTSVHKRLQTGPPFYLPSVNSAFYFIARLRRQTPANGTQSNFAKRWTVNRANSLP